MDKYSNLKVFILFFINMIGVSISWTIAVDLNNWIGYVLLFLTTPAFIIISIEAYKRLRL